MQDEAEQREMQCTEKLNAMKRETLISNDKLKTQLSTMDSVCEQLRLENATAIAELKEQHRLELLSITESQEEQVCVGV